MDMFNMAKQNRILEIQVGSRLYGTSNDDPTKGKLSDTDYSGVFVADLSCYIGFNHVEEVDFSKISKLENGQNAPDAIDKKLYEVKKFLRLAMDNNPNIIEHVFVNEKNIVYSNHWGKEILRYAKLFPHKGCFEKFIGYATSQKHKMIIKRDNMEFIEAAIEFFSKQDPKSLMAEHKQMFGLCKFKFNNNHVTIGDMAIQLNINVKRALEQLNERKDKFGSRHELVSKHGYDTKFASHLIRLLKEGEDLLKYGELTFPLPQAELILDIKQGKYSVEEVMHMATMTEDDMRCALNESKLPSGPRVWNIEQLLLQIIRGHHNF